MIQSTNLNAFTAFKRSSSEFVRRLKETGLPEVLTIEGRGELVVQDATAYQRFLDVVDRADAILGIRRDLDDVKQDRTMTLDEFGDRLRARMKASDKPARGSNPSRRRRRSTRVTRATDTRS